MCTAMFELNDLPSYETLVTLGKQYHNPDIDGLQSWLIWASATREMLSAFEANLATNCSLSQTQFFVMILLKRNPDGLSIGTLANGVAVTSQTMTRTIDRMEANAWCHRDPDPQDRRAWLIRLTPEGDEVLSKALPIHYAWVAKLMSHFNADERQMLNQLMRKINQADVFPKGEGS